MRSPLPSTWPAIYNALAATQVLDRPQVRTYVLGADGTQSREPMAGQ
jgi:hypothetical protein